MVRVAIIDDHESVILGLEAACVDAGFEAVGSGATVGDISACLDGGCDIVLLDLSLGDGSTIPDNVSAILGAGVAVLVHSIADRVAAVREALAAGAAGVIPKSLPTAETIAAIRRVAAGEPLDNLEWASAVDSDREFAKARLGRRERDVLHLYASGLPLKAVAAQLGISVSTAQQYLESIRGKYTDAGRPAATQSELTRRAVEDGVASASVLTSPDRDG